MVLNQGMVLLKIRGCFWNGGRFRLQLGGGFKLGDGSGLGDGSS